MQNHQPFTLYRADGSAVQVRNYYRSPAARLADYLISDDGRVIYCEDETQGVFWYKDTEEKLYRDNPNRHHPEGDQPLTTCEVADAYIALRANHDTAEAAEKVMAEYSLSPQDLINALGVEIINGSRSNFNEVREYRNEVLSHFKK